MKKKVVRSVIILVIMFLSLIALGNKEVKADSEAVISFSFEQTQGELRIDGKSNVLRQDTFKQYINSSVGADNIKIITFVSDVSLSASSSAQLFSKLSNLVTINNIGKLDISNVTDLNYMFLDCNHLRTLDLSEWDTSKVTNMEHMFQGCSNLSSLNASTWDTANVTNMEYMFVGCSSLRNIDMYNVYEESWNTENVTNMLGMFQGCDALESLDLRNWNIEKVEDIRNILADCSSLEELYTPKVCSEQAVILPTRRWYNAGNINDDTIYEDFKAGIFDYSIYLKKLIDYRITYHLDGGTAYGNPETYNALSKFSLKSPTKTNCDFLGWTGSNGNEPQTDVLIDGRKMTGDLEYTANWDSLGDPIPPPVTNKAYQVQHWQQNVNGNPDSHNQTNYTLMDTDNFSDEVGTKVTPSTKTYTGFTAPNTQEMTITENGENVVSYYYTRNRYTVTLVKDEGIESVSGQNDYYYEQEVEIDATVKENYLWVNWTGYEEYEDTRNTFTMPSRAVELKANSIKKASVTTKYMDINTKKELAEAVVENGYEGKDYQTTEKKIEGYQTVKVEGIPEGKMSGDRVVTYFMAKNTKIQISYKDKATGKQIADMRFTEGYVGKKYEVKPIQIDGYQYIACSDNTSGVMTEKVIEISFEYLQETGLNVKYVDMHTNEEIAEAKHYDFLVSEKYDVSKDYQDIENYTFIKDSGNLKGTMEAEELTVVYYYAYTSSITVKYYDIFSNKEIADEDVIEGYEGKEYDIKPKEIKGYQFTKTNDSKGEMKREKTETKYYYTKETSIEIQYLDATTEKPIRDSKIIKGIEGQEYDESKVEDLEGYVLSKKATNTKGKMGPDKIEIKNYYARKSKITLKYMDIDTKKEIKSKKEYEFISGENYQIKEAVDKIEGYNFVSTSKDLQGKMTNEDITIEVYYRKNQPTSDKKDETNQNNTTNQNKNQNQSSENKNQKDDTNKDNTLFKGVIPKAGIRMILVPTIVVMVFICFRNYKNYKKYRDIDK